MPDSARSEAASARPGPSAADVLGTAIDLLAVSGWAPVKRSMSGGGLNVHTALWRAAACYPAAVDLLSEIAERVLAAAPPHPAGATITQVEAAHIKTGEAAVEWLRRAADREPHPGDASS